MIVHSNETYKCKMCGAEQPIKVDNSISLPPEWNKKFDVIKKYLICPECDEKLTRRIEYNAIRHKISQAVQEGKLDKLIFTCTFQDSDPTIESGVNKDIYDYLRQFTFNKNLWLWGRPGIGKTYLLFAVCNKGCFEFNKTVYSINAAMLPTIIKGNETKFVETYSYPDLLAIDDIDKIMPDEKILPLLFTLFENRYNHCKRTFFSANMFYDDLFRAWDGKLKPIGSSYLSAIVDRLKPLVNIELIGTDSLRTKSERRIIS